MKHILGREERRKSNQDVEGRGKKDGGISAEEGVGDKGPQKREQRGCTGQGVDILRCGGRRLPELVRQEVNQVGADSVVGKSLHNLHS